MFSFPDSDIEVSEEEPEEIESPKKIPSLNFEFSGTLDLRLTHTGKEQSWTKSGRGLSYYGADGSDHTTELQFTRFGIVSDIFYENFHLHTQLQADDGPEEKGKLGLGEMFLGYKYNLSSNKRMTSRLGLLIPSISLEHPNEVWSTKYTITASAINSWIAEEIRPLAMEFNWTYDVQNFFPLTLTTAIFSHNDPAGSILAWRGWALHDFQWRTGSHLPTQQVPNHLVPDAQAVQPFKEIDDRPGYYIGLKFTSPEHYQLSFFHSNSLSKDNVLDETNEYSWNTRYEQIALKYTPEKWQNWTFLSQAMTGHTWMGKPDDPGVAVDFWSVYLLGSYRFNDAQRFSIRWDKFRVDDTDVQADQNDSKGEAYTFAYLHTYKEKHLLALEYVYIDSRRIGNEGHPDNDPHDDLLQFAYRFSF